MNVFSGEGCIGGKCQCGAVFVIDEAGRFGGQALMDAQALLCEGDLDRAMKLDSKQDLEVRTRPITETERHYGDRFQPHGHAAPKVWALKLRE